MVFDPVWRMIGAVREDFDRLQRSLGVTPYRWQVHFLGTGEIAERERAFGSPERAFYNLQGYLTNRIREGISDKGDLVTLTIENTETWAMVSEVRNRRLGTGTKHTIGYLVAELLGYEV